MSVFIHRLRHLLVATSFLTFGCAWAQEAPVPDETSPPPESTTEQIPTVADVIAVEPLRATPPPSAPTEEAAPTRLEEIVVTATKRASPVRDIPATISVLSGEDLEREGIQSIDQIVTQVPGVNLTDDGLGQAKRVTIRGISADVNANFTAGTLLGDIPFSDPFVPKVQLDPNPFDMATVEILKGPQGTLFGGSGLNGMIRYVPEAPQLDEFQLKYYTQLTSYPGNGGSGWSYGAVINAPFADNTAGIRLMGFSRDTPGFIDDTRADKRDINTTSQYGFRGMLTWLPSYEWKVTLLATTQHTEQDDVAFTDNFDGQLERSSTPRPSPSESTYSLGNLGLERSFSWGDFISQTSVFEKEFDVFIDASRVALGGSVPLLSAVGHNNSDGWSQELRLVSSGDSAWKWLAGAFFFDMNLYDCAEAGAAAGLPGLPSLPGLEGLLATPCEGNADKLAGTLDIAQLVGDIKVRETALFGELTRELGEDWELTLGARAYRTQSGGTVSTAGVLYSAQNLGMPNVRDATVTERGISPKASIVFHPTDDLRAYFTASRGFRFGGPQLGASTPTTEVPETYKSDSLWNYELGVRTDWLDRSLRLDASLYLIDWKDPQVGQQSNDSLATFIDNVGGVRGTGAEVSLRYAPAFLPDLTLNTSVAWNQTETTEAFESASGQLVPVGSPWPLSPRWQSSTTLGYVLPIETWLIGTSLRHSYMGKACNTIECTGEVFGFNTMDFTISLSSVSGGYWPQLGLTLSNLTDERGYSNISTSPTLGDSVNYIPPRMVVLRLSGSF